MKEYIKRLIREVIEENGESSCHNICTNGKDTYHQWNMKYAGQCSQCGTYKLKRKKKINASHR